MNYPVLNQTSEVTLGWAGPSRTIFRNNQSMFLEAR